MRLFFIPFPVIMIFTNKFLSNWMGALSFGPFILMRPKHESDRGLHVHELEHSKHWWATFLIGLVAYLLTHQIIFLSLGIGGYGIAYKLSKKFRLLVEAHCYREQIAHYPPERNVMWAANHLATNYSLGITQDDARDILKIDADGYYRP